MTTRPATQARPTDPAGQRVTLAAAPTTARPAEPSRQPASPTSSAPTARSTKPSRTTARATSPAAPTTNPTTAGNVQGALSELRAAVAAVSSSGQIEAKRAEELRKRVDELAKHLTEKGGKDADKHLDDMDKYLRQLSNKGELTADGERRIAAAVQTVREQMAEG
jgi:hypothetical protein